MKDPVTVSITVPQAYLRALADDVGYVLDDFHIGDNEVYDVDTANALFGAYTQLRDACNSTPVPTTDPDVFEDVEPVDSSEPDDDDDDESALALSTPLQDHHLPDETINVNETEDACQD